MLYRLLSHMDRSRYENIVISLTDMGTLGHRIESLGIRVHTLGKRQERTTHSIGMRRFLYLSLIGLWRLVFLLRSERPRILQTWLYHADLLGLVAGKLAGVATIAWNVRCTESNEQRNLAMSLLAHMSRYPQVILVNSTAGRILHESRGYRPKSWVYIPNGFDVGEFKPDSDARTDVRKELGLGPDSILIGLISRDHPLKDNETFLRAVGILYPTHPDVHFVMVGPKLDGQNSKLAGLIAQLKLESYVHLLGGRSDIPRLASSFDIGVLSSCAEGFPNVVGEIMACGVPCVVTDVGDAAFLLGETGRIVPPKNPEALGKACIELIEAGSEGRRVLGKKARERMVELFDIRKIVSQYEALYSSLSETPVPCS